MKSTLSRLLARTPLAYWPVRVRSGIAQGARWTLLPYSAYWRGGGEPDVAAAIASITNLEGQCCWDLGAHFGIYTVGLAMAVGPQGQIASFEPDPTAHARCARHIRMNKLAQVRLYRAGVGERESQLNLIVNDGPGSTTGHLAYEDETPKPNQTTMPVRIVALDTLVASGEIRAPVFVKVDVEGHGAKALRGARDTLSRHQPVLVMSFHSKYELEDTRELLAPIGYTCFTPDQKPQDWADAIFKTALLRPSKST